MVHNHVAAKFLWAAALSAGVAVQQASAAAGVEVDAGHLITILLAGTMGLIATLIGTAWKDLRERLREAEEERAALRRQVRELHEFRSRATWVCPLMDPTASVAQQRKHLRQHLQRLEEDDD